MGHSSSRAAHPTFMSAEGLSSDEGENSIDEFYTKQNGLIRPEIAAMWEEKGVTVEKEWMDKDELLIFRRKQKQELKQKRLETQNAVLRKATIDEAAARASTEDAEKMKVEQKQADLELEVKKSEVLILRKKIKQSKNRDREPRQDGSKTIETMSRPRPPTTPQSSSSSSSSSTSSPNKPGSPTGSTSSITSDERKKLKMSKTLLKLLRMKAPTQTHPPAGTPSQTLQPPRREYPRPQSDGELNHTGSSLHVILSPKSGTSLPTKSKSAIQIGSPSLPDIGKIGALKPHSRKKHGISIKVKPRKVSIGRKSRPKKHRPITPTGAHKSHKPGHNVTRKAARQVPPEEAKIKQPTAAIDNLEPLQRTLIYQFKRWTGTRGGHKREPKPQQVIHPQGTAAAGKEFTATTRGKIAGDKGESSSPGPGGYSTDNENRASTRRKKKLRKRRKRSKPTNATKVAKHPSFSRANANVFARIEFEERNTKMLQAQAREANDFC